MKTIFTVAAIALALTSTSALADTRDDFISHPENYAALSYQQGLPTGKVVTFDIPVNASLLAGAATPVAGGKVLASDIAYARPIASLQTPLGMATTPYPRQ